MARFIASVTIIVVAVRLHVNDQRIVVRLVIAPAASAIPRVEHSQNIKKRHDISLAKTVGRHNALGITTGKTHTIRCQPAIRRTQPPPIRHYTVSGNVHAATSAYREGVSIRQIKHGHQRPQASRIPVIITAAICAIAVVVSLGAWWRLRPADGSEISPHASTAAGNADISREGVPSPIKRTGGAKDTQPGNGAKDAAAKTGVTTDDSAAGRAQRAVAAMSLEEQAGQLVMAPLFAGNDPSTLQSLIVDRHVGSIVLLGNWNSGTAGVRASVDALQSYAPNGNKLIVSADQEGGLVQHLKGAGFDTMPSAVTQGQMTVDSLKQYASGWGAQLVQAGVNVDLAPVLGTVQVSRSSNAPIGALNRDFGLDAAGNAQHGAAFIEGLRMAGVGGTVKHYPGLGAVTGNTDFTTQGILDTTTTTDGAEINAFNTVIAQNNPSMVMMSLATYQSIDPSAPAAFSQTIISGTLRGGIGYQGVVISDSLSAAAVSSVPSGELGVRLVDAGGDLACLGETSLVQPVLDGIIARANTDPAFAKKVTASATRVMTLKYQLGLAS